MPKPVQCDPRINAVRRDATLAVFELLVNRLQQLVHFSADLFLRLLLDAFFDGSHVPGYAPAPTPDPRPGGRPSHRQDFESPAMARAAAAAGVARNRAIARWFTYPSSVPLRAYRTA